MSPRIGGLVVVAIFAFLSAARGGEADQIRGRGDAPGLVIVAAERFHPAISPYRDVRATQRPTELASLEAILRTSPGADDPEKLKRWLYSRWRDRGVRYVLLVGDASILPVRYMVLDRVTPAAFDFAFYPADLYYADVARRDGSFDDWNAQREGFHASYFGEVRGEKNKTDPINFDQVDYRPELAVGRWPVETVAEVECVANKTLARDRWVRQGNRSPAPDPRLTAFVNIPGWVDTRTMMRGWADALPSGWGARLLPGLENGRHVKADEARIVELLNTGAGLVIHTGHGQEDRWEGSLGVSALPKLTNADRLPVILSAGCSTARFATLPPYEPYEDVNGVKHQGTNDGEVFRAPPPAPSPYARGAFNLTGLGEQLLRSGPAGAAAYIGCNTGSQPCALTLLEGFLRAVTSRREEITLGDCWADAVTHYFEAEHLATITPSPDWYPASIFFQSMKFMLFGDPCLRLPSAVADDARP